MRCRLFPFQITIDSDEYNNYIQYVDRHTNKLLEENVPGKRSLQYLYSSFFGKIVLESIMARSLIQYLQGFFMNTRISKLFIKAFAKKYDVNIDESLHNIGKFKSFNDFFTRKLKDTSRPINNNNKTIISPADGKVLVFEKATESMNFYIKDSEFNLPAFICNDTLTKQFKDASMAIIRLAPADYHRFHFPINCTPSKSLLIKGKYYSVSPLALKKEEMIFEKNKREICLLKNSILGDVLMIEVGATFVGSIVQTYPYGIDVEKGDEKGYFKFGGSTIVLLFKEGRIRFDDDLQKNTKKGFETTIKMGEPIANFII
ncbi:MAG TPA: archaetidylserine decarboxylase [Candidatus Cloacimonadota bacterium]|nr:archaetidylserine decarboxylase [Candidatus Cloacimonadota bacterium]HQB41158.1 archaetidylserine decarboxylase [Candidatus Cloacimonadota bacterium]